LKDRGQAAEAARCYRRAVQCDPSLAEAHYNLGILLQRQGRAAGAMQCYRDAIRARADYAQAHNNLGMLYLAQGDLEKAGVCLSKALEFKPDSADVVNNLGNLMKFQGRWTEARVCYQQALQIAGDYALAHFNLAQWLLADGDFATGWSEYEWRSRCPEFAKHPLHQPRWQGDALVGRALLVRAEQGLGDTMQFVRYVGPLAQRGGTIILEVQRALVRLLKQSPVGELAQLVAAGDPLPKFDAYVPLLSLPGIFGTTPENIPAAGGYLSADPGLVEQWRGALGDAGPFKVGIAWQGRPAYGDYFRSIPLASFAPLALDGVELVSLQKGPGALQLAALGGQFPVRDLGPELDEAHGAFMDTAAVMKNLDLVVTSDTATAHLAGALGVEVWVALTLAPDWRWMRERTDSPWYASMRLFRQTQLGDWAGVFERMAEALRQFTRAP
jgi:Tfp pilus assembly protein PilF